VLGPSCELTDVGKAYRGRFVVSGVNLSVAPGEMVALTGRSGSGKSTLLNIIGLLEGPDRGELRLFGERAPRVGSSASTRMLRSRLGYLFQNYALIDDDTVDSNLQIAQAYVRGSRTRKGADRAEALASVGLPGFGRRRVYELSGGEQQRVAIARLMLKPCDLVLADEPTGSLDQSNAAAVMAMLRDLNTRGRAIVIASHDERISAACDRIFRLPDPHFEASPGADRTPQGVAG
jgi:putative ABC transport system ATP-binding protein